MQGLAGTRRGIGVKQWEFIYRWFFWAHDQSPGWVVIIDCSCRLRSISLAIAACFSIAIAGKTAHCNSLGKGQMPKYEI